MPAKNNNETMASVLAKAQMELPKAVKSAENPFFNSRYAGLDEVIEACRNVLNKYGISITQTVEYTPEVTKTPEGGGDMQYFPQQVFLVTTLLYQDQSIRSIMPLEYKKADMQSLGSAISYARRYSLQSICCLATDEPDDDGNKAVGDVEMSKKGGNRRTNYKRKPEPQKVAATTADDFLPKGKV